MWIPTSDQVMAFSAFGTLVITVVLAYFNQKYIKLTRDMLDSQTDPYVYVSIAIDRTRETMLQLIVKNSGQGVANDIKVSGLSRFPVNDEIKSTLEKGISCLGPYETFVVDIGLSTDIDNADKTEHYEIVCSYKKGNRDMPITISNLLIGSLNGCPIYSVERDIATALKGINEHMRHINIDPKISEKTNL